MPCNKPTALANNFKPMLNKYSFANETSVRKFLEVFGTGSTSSSWYLRPFQ